MHKRKPGTSGLEIAPLALGGNVFGWAADACSRWAPDHKGGEAETVIGAWRKTRGAGPIYPGKMLLRD